MQETKELSEHELAALGSVSRALDEAAVTPVYINFVRRFRRSREVKRNWMLSRTVRFTFGFRCFSTDEGGIGEALVLLRHTPVADGARLAHNYFVWAPEGVVVTITKGQDSMMSVPRHVMNFKLGNNSHYWMSRVDLA